MNILLTGGCGFIGCNSAGRFSKLGHDVTIFDDLSRSRTNQNLVWLKEQGDFKFVKGDLRNEAQLSDVVKQGNFDVVLHLAAQVAVTTSVLNPRHDFEVNALGTFNLLEAVRLQSPETIVINASTNKVYGKLEGLEVSEETTRYSLPALPQGVNESQPLDFHSPYGCSKGSADQYVADYARIYGMRTVVLRQSCIYGYRQFGVEDQGWAAWFTIAHLMRRPVKIYGTGKQVRDVLFIDDLVDCYLATIENIGAVAGMTFNIGGGPTNSLSLLEFLDALHQLSKRPVDFSFADWRPGDQPVYISDIGLAQKLLGWSPKINTSEGVERLFHWVADNQGEFAQAFGSV